MLPRGSIDDSNAMLYPLEFPESPPEETYESPPLDVRSDTGSPQHWQVWFSALRTRKHELNAVLGGDHA